MLAAWTIAVVPSLALFAARVAFGGASLQTPEGAGIAGFAAYSIVIAPLVETMVMVPLALALNALPAKSDWPRVFALAALAALAHGFGGTAWQVAAAFWPFVVYSAALFAWRRRSLERRVPRDGARPHALQRDVLRRWTGRVARRGQLTRDARLPARARGSRHRP